MCHVILRRFSPALPHQSNRDARETQLTEVRQERSTKVKSTFVDSNVYESRRFFHT
jgi:hypothetical protein